MRASNDLIIAVDENQITERVRKNHTMANEAALEKLGNIARPAKELVDRISNVLGVVIDLTTPVQAPPAIGEAALQIFEPFQLSDAEKRGVLRMVREQGKIQQNVEAITAGSLPEINENATPEALEDDWISHFFEKCKFISNAEMQTVWSKILAGETNRAGTFSMRTIDLLSSLDKRDADLFTALCGFTWNVGIMVPMVFDVEAEIYTEKGINFEKLSNLASLGLINMFPEGLIRTKIKEPRIVSYFGQLIKVESASESWSLKIGVVNFSQAGSELATICGSQQIKGFVEYVVKRWSEGGLVTSSPILFRQKI